MPGNGVWDIVELWGDPQLHGAVTLVVLRVGGGVLLAHGIELHLLPPDALLAKESGDTADAGFGRGHVPVVRADLAGRALHPDNALVVVEHGHYMLLQIVAVLVF